MDAAQTLCSFEIDVQSFCSTGKELHVVEEVQDSGGGEAQQKDGEHQRAGSDIHHPVMVRLLQLGDDADEAEDRDPERNQEAEDGEEEVVVEQEDMGVEVQR